MKYLFLICTLSIQFIAFSINLITSQVHTSNLGLIADSSYRFNYKIRIDNIDTIHSNVVSNWYLSTDSIIDISDITLKSRSIKGPFSPNWNRIYFDNLTIPSIDTGNYYIILKVSTISNLETDSIDNIIKYSRRVRSLAPNFYITTSSLSKEGYIQGIYDEIEPFETIIHNYGEINSTIPVAGIINFKRLGEEVILFSENFNIPPLKKDSSFTYMSQTYDISNLKTDTGFYITEIKIDNNNQFIESNEFDNIFNNYFTRPLIYTDSVYNLEINNTTANIATCNLTLFDDGGKDGDYSPNLSQSINFYPAEEGKKIMINIKNHSYITGDGLEVLLTPTTRIKATQLNQIINKNVIPLLKHNESYLAFKSNDSLESAGFEIEISCTENNSIDLFNLKTDKDVYALALDSTYTVSFSHANNILDQQFNFSIGLSTDTVTDSFISFLNYSIPSYLGDTTNYSNEIIFPANIKDYDSIYVFISNGLAKPIFKKIHLTNSTTQQYYTSNKDTIKFQKDTILLIKTCNSTITDDGGINGNYTDNFYGSIHIIPEDNMLLVLDIKTNLKSNEEYINNRWVTRYDSLKLRDGVTNDIIKDYTSLHFDDYREPFDTTHGVTLDFSTNKETTSTGFNIHVSCVHSYTDLVNDSISISADTLYLDIDKNIQINAYGTVKGSPIHPSVTHKIFITTTKDTINSLYQSDNLQSFNRDSQLRFYAWRLIFTGFINTPGKYYIISMLDHNYQENESNEINNLLIDSIIVLPKPLEYYPEALNDTTFINECPSKITNRKGPNTFDKALYNYYAHTAYIEKGIKNIRINNLYSSNGDLMFSLGYSLFNNVINVSEIDINDFPVYLPVDSLKDFYISFYSQAGHSITYQYDIDFLCTNIITSNNDLPITPLTIYPNPVQNIIHLNFNGYKEISSITGTILTSTNENNIDVSEFPPGTYFIKSILNKQINIYKFVKE